MWSKSPFGSASHFANIVSWKAGSPTSNPQRLKAESVRLFVDLKQTQCKTTEIKINILQFKSWILDTAELVQRAAALRDLKLLVGNLDNSSLLRGLVYMEMWATFARCHSKWLWRPQTKKVWSKLHCDRHEYELLGSSEDSKFGHRKFTPKNHSNPSVIHNSSINPDDVRAGSWLPTQ